MNLNKVYQKAIIELINSYPPFETKRGRPIQYDSIIKGLIFHALLEVYEHSELSRMLNITRRTIYNHTRVKVSNYPQVYELIKKAIKHENKTNR